jgi:hypothetical protein
MSKLYKHAVVFLLTSTVSAFAQAQAPAAVEETLIPEQSIILPWIVGLGILAAVVIVGFKNSGRTHLD